MSMKIEVKLITGIKRKMVIGKPITIEINNLNVPIGEVIDYDEETLTALIDVNEAMLATKWTPVAGMNIGAFSPSFQAALNSIEQKEEEWAKNKKERMRKKYVAEVADKIWDDRLARNLKSLNEECDNTIKTAMDNINKDDWQKELFAKILAASKKINEANRKQNGTFISIPTKNIEDIAKEYNISFDEACKMVEIYCSGKIDVSSVDEDSTEEYIRNLAVKFRKSCELAAEYYNCKTIKDEKSN